MMETRKSMGRSGVPYLTRNRPSCGTRRSEISSSLRSENAEHSILAMNRGHDGDAEVNGAFGSAVFDPEPAVLRDTALGNIELAQIGERGAQHPRHESRA